MKNILLLGDSIRMSYQANVRRLLEGRANVYGPDDCCRFAKYSLWYINEWIATAGTPDIIHWNNGIWDAYQVNADMDVITPVDEYVRDMKRLYNELKKTGAVVIFATTTPAKKGYANLSNENIDLYNKKILDEFSRDEIYINDLNAFVNRDLDRMICDDLHHLTEYGVERVSEQIADFLSKFI